MDQVLVATLTTAVEDRLDLLDDLADRNDAASLAQLAESELPSLTATIRDLLLAHQADERGRCRGCRVRWRRRACPVRTCLYRHLIGDIPGQRDARHARHLAAP